MEGIVNQRWRALLLATSFIAATSLFTVGLVKIWGYQHPNSKLAHGFTTLVG